MSTQFCYFNKNKYVCPIYITDIIVFGTVFHIDINDKIYYNFIKAAQLMKYAVSAHGE